MVEQIQNSYVVTPTGDGGFIAYVVDNAVSCSAFGDTREEAIDHLSECLGELVNEVYDFNEYEWYETKN